MQNQYNTVAINVKKTGKYRYKIKLYNNEASTLIAQKIYYTKEFSVNLEQTDLPPTTSGGNQNTPPIQTTASNPIPSENQTTKDESCCIVKHKIRLKKKIGWSLLILLFIAMALWMKNKNKQQQ